MTRKGTPRAHARWKVVDCARMVVAAYNNTDGEALAFALEELRGALLTFDDAQEEMVAQRMAARGQRLLDRDFQR